MFRIEEINECLGLKRKLNVKGWRDKWMLRAEEINECLGW